MAFIANPENQGVQQAIVKVAIKTTLVDYARLVSLSNTSITWQVFRVVSNQVLGGTNDDNEVDVNLAYQPIGSEMPLTIEGIIPCYVNDIVQLRVDLKGFGDDPFASLEKDGTALCVFTGWSGDINGKQASVTLKIQQIQHQVYANFGGYSFEANYTPESAFNTPPVEISGYSRLKGEYFFASAATIEASRGSIASGMSFRGWQGDLGGNITLRLDGEVNIPGGSTPVASVQSLSQIISPQSPFSGGDFTVSVPDSDSGSPNYLPSDPGSWSAEDPTLFLKTFILSDSYLTAVYGRSPKLRASVKNGYVSANFSRDMSEELGGSLDGQRSKISTSVFYGDSVTLEFSAPEGTGRYISDMDGDLYPPALVNAVSQSGIKTSATVSLKMNSDRNISVTFKDPPTIRVSATGDGSGEISVGGVDDIPTGGSNFTIRPASATEAISLTATAEKYSMFTGWVGNFDGKPFRTTKSNETVTVLSPTIIRNRCPDYMSFSAEFRKCPSLEVYVSPEGAGTVTGEGIATDDEAKAIYENVLSKSVGLTASANSGYLFKKWSCDKAGSSDLKSESITVTVDEDGVYASAIFEIDQDYTPPEPEPEPEPDPTVTVNISGAGGYVIADGQTITESTSFEVSKGAMVFFEAKLDDDEHYFIGWSGSLSGDYETQNLEVETSKTVTATFAENPYTVSVIGIENGSVSGGNIDCPSGSCSQTFPPGGQATLTASPADGYEFEAWTGDVTGAENPVQIADINEDYTISATFYRLPILTVSVEGEGAVDVNG